MHTMINEVRMASSGITRLTALFICSLMPDLVIFKHRPECGHMSHDTECPY